MEAIGAELKALSDQLNRLRMQSTNDKNARKQLVSNLEKNKLQELHHYQVNQQQVAQIVVGNIPIGYDLENLLPFFYQFGWVNLVQSKFLLEPTDATPGRAKIVFGRCRVMCLYRIP